MLRTVLIALVMLPVGMALRRIIGESVPLVPINLIKFLAVRVGMNTLAN